MLDPVILSIPIFAVLILLEIAWDALQKRKGYTGKYRLNDALTNISCGILDQVTGIFAKVFTIGAYALVFNWSDSFRPWTWPSQWVCWALAFIAVDFAYYWSHRWSHEVNLFWLGHVVHHQSEDYNLSVALRQGALQKMLMFWVYLPLALIGFPPEWFVYSMAFNLLYQFWIHTEVVGKLGPVEWVLNTPSHHRVHHGRNPKYIDKNHAGVFIVWDRLFGTFAKEEETPTYGITTPTASFNPVWAHAKPFAEMAGELRQIHGWADKLRFMFKPPGWYPAALGGFKAPPEITGTETKYHFVIPLALNVYYIAQFLMILGITSWFLFTFENYDWFTRAALTVSVIWFVFTLGDLLDKKSRAVIPEFVRLVLLMGAGGWAFAKWNSVGALMVAFAALTSLVWFAFVYTKYKNEFNR